MVKKSGGPQVIDCLSLLLFSYLFRQNLSASAAPAFQCFKYRVTNITFFAIILGCHHVWTTLFMSVTMHTPGLKSRTTNAKY